MAIKSAGNPALTVTGGDRDGRRERPWFRRGAFATLTSSDPESAARTDHTELDKLLRDIRGNITGRGDATEATFTLTGLAY